MSVDAESATVPSPGRRIRENVVVLVNPVAERDGRDKVVDFYRYLKGRTDYGRLPRQSPTYWGRYVFVDINRDAHQLTMADPAVSGIALDCGDRFVYNPPVEPHGRDRPRR